MLKILLCIVVTLFTVFDSTRGDFAHPDPVNDWIIKPFNVIATYDEATQLCRARGAIVASPINEELLTKIKSIISAQRDNSSYFIGTVARHSPKQFVSEKGVALEDMPDTVMLRQLDPRDGHCLSMSSDGVRVVSCYSRLPYICYKQDPLFFKKPQCDSGYTYINETRNCYKLNTVQVTWQKALSTCSDEGAHLAVLNDNNEAEAVAKFVEGSQHNYPWLGLRDLDGKGNWRSIDDQPVEQLFHKWYNGVQPKTDLTCSHLHCKEPVLGYAPCTSNNHIFLCEKKPYYVNTNFNKLESTSPYNQQQEILYKV